MNPTAGDLSLKRQVHADDVLQQLTKAGDRLLDAQRVILHVAQRPPPQPRARRSSDGAKLRGVGPVETDPREPVAAPVGGVELGQALGRSDSLAVTIDSEVSDHVRPASEDATAQTMPSATATRRPAQVSCAVSP